MIALNTTEERAAHHGIAIGFTEEWIREQIKENFEEQHGDAHPRMTDNVIDHAFDIVIEAWEELETQAITDIIESACDDAWETDYV